MPWEIICSPQKCPAYSEATKHTHSPSTIFDKTDKMIVILHLVIVTPLCANTLVMSYHRSTSLCWICFVYQMEYYLWYIISMTPSNLDHWSDFYLEVPCVWCWSDRCVCENKHVTRSNLMSQGNGALNVLSVKRLWSIYNAICKAKNGKETRKWREFYWFHWVFKESEQDQE